MSFAKRLLETRKKKGLSQEQVARLLNTKAPVIGRYERDEAKPSVEVAANLANILEVSLDFLVGNVDMEFDSKTLSRIQEVSGLPEQDKDQVFLLIDALLRDFKAKKAYAS